METKELVMVITISLIVAVVASVATMSLTGDTIKVNQNLYGKYNVYTKGEIDAKMNAINLNCTIMNLKPDEKTATDSCATINKRCVFAYRTISYDVKESKNGSCSGNNFWSTFEHYEQGLMFEPSNCDDVALSVNSEPAVWGIPASNGPMFTEQGKCNDYTCCFKGDELSFEGRDVAVKKKGTHQVALCC